MAGNQDLFRSKYQGPLEQELRETFAGQDGLLYNMLLYQMGWMDENGTPTSRMSRESLHPLLCLLSCESLMGEYEPALPAAAAVELVRNFSLIHEDIQSGNPDREDRPAVWWVWGPGQAINAGDGMHALARLALMRLEERGMAVDRVLDALRLLDQSCLEMFEGQHQDLAYQERLDLGVNPYLKMAAGKTGALTACAMGLGALSAGQEEVVVETFRACGRSLGVARQIVDDVQDLWGGGEGTPPSNNALNKKKLLPIVYALETAEVSTKRELGTLYFKRVLEAPDVLKIVDILDQGSARDFCLEKAREYCQDAMDALGSIHISAWGREQLHALCRHISEGER